MKISFFTTGDIEKTWEQVKKQALNDNCLDARLVSITEFSCPNCGYDPLLLGLYWDRKVGEQKFQYCPNCDGCYTDSLLDEVDILGIAQKVIDYYQKNAFPNYSPIGRGKRRPKIR